MPSLMIGNEVVLPKNPVNTFEFVISQMSGDADSYNSEVIKIETAEEAINFTLLLNCIKRYSNGYYHTVDKMTQVIKQNLSADIIKSAIGDSYLDETIIDIIGYDVTSHSDVLASLDSYEIFWYDEVGKKFAVSFVE